VKRFAQDVVGPKVREMDENEMMDPSVINGLFEQGVRKSAFPRSIQLTFVIANGDRDKRGAWRRRVLFHFSDNCD
jgi:hypothetical protein